MLDDIDCCVSIDTVCSTHMADDHMTEKVSSDIYPTLVTSGDIMSNIFTDYVCSIHGAEDHMIAQVPSYIYPSPVPSGDMESSILTNTVCSTHMTAVCIQTQYFVAEVKLIMITILLFE